MFRLSRCPKCLSAQVRWSSTVSEGVPKLPPLLTKIKNDMLPAMRAKDKIRLNVLRAIISEANNAVHTPRPIETDLQVLQLIRKRISSSQTAVIEFVEAKRDDLKEKQEAEIAVLQQYAGLVEMVPDEDIYGTIDGAISASKESLTPSNPGAILKELFRPGGGLDGKAVDRAHVATIVADRLKRKPEVV